MLSGKSNKASVADVKKGAAFPCLLKYSRGIPTKTIVGKELLYMGLKGLYFFIVWLYN